jgi:hypothetical protein
VIADYKKQYAMANKMAYALVGPPKHRNHIDLAILALKTGREFGLEDVEERPNDALHLVVSRNFALDNAARSAA